MPDIYRIVVSFYVGTIHLIGRGLGKIGALSLLDRHTDKPTAHYLRSLFAVYDIDGLIGLDVPWWTYRSIDKVDRFLEDHPSARAFEYGSGASSVWLAKRVAELKSVEHDAKWYPIVQDRLKDFPHANLTLETPDHEPDADPIYHSQKQGQIGDSFLKYASSIDADNTKYDLIVIDGRARQACLKHALAHLATGGMIVFDNSKRKRYRDAILESGMSAHFLPGLTPSLPYPDETSLLTFSVLNA